MTLAVAIPACGGDTPAIMQHRHLQSQEFTPAAVDDIIRRGGWRDWVALRRAAHRDAEVRERIRRVCGSLTREPRQENAQRLSFWNKYVQRLSATVG
ncbi:MAG: hypothetical protein IAE77_04730 [Prosthecobacter sp.]|jgi:hypothetical protein|uniref:hypothetical protein n=1 Tax=Prosthecobacter sp. TaxID=1965333 RepID=UPI0019DCF222|nr:hypothetical protein [Prosthecobacter sp.]MBE2282749.1 hypothetical protein [Prosthecobacter sp.]